MSMNLAHKKRRLFGRLSCSVWCSFLSIPHQYGYKKDAMFAVKMTPRLFYREDSIPLR